MAVKLGTLSKSRGGEVEHFLVNQIDPYKFRQRFVTKDTFPLILGM